MSPSIFSTHWCRFRLPKAGLSDHIALLFRSLLEAFRVKSKLFNLASWAFHDSSWACPSRLFFIVPQISSSSSQSEASPCSAPPLSLCSSWSLCTEHPSSISIYLNVAIPSSPPLSKRPHRTLLLQGQMMEGWAHELLEKTEGNEGTTSVVARVNKVLCPTQIPWHVPHSIFCHFWRESPGVHVCVCLGLAGSVLPSPSGHICPWRFSWFWNSIRWLSFFLGGWKWANRFHLEESSPGPQAPW